MSKGTKQIRLGRVERMIDEIETVKRWSDHPSQEHQQGFDRAMNIILMIVQEHFPEIDRSRNGD
jgi:hypothetical protein